MVRGCVLPKVGNRYERSGSKLMMGRTGVRGIIPKRRHALAKDALRFQGTLIAASHRVTLE